MTIGVAQPLDLVQKPTVTVTDVIIKIIIMGDFSSDEDCGEEVSKITEKDKHVTLVSYVFFFILSPFRIAHDGDRTTFFFLPETSDRNLLFRKRC